MASLLANVDQTWVAIIAVVASVVLLVERWTRVKTPFTLSFPLSIAEEVKSIHLPKYKIQGPVLVTGGAGFLGRHLVDALLENGLEVVVFDLAKSYQPPKGVTFVCGDLTAKDTLKDTLINHKIQAVFHVASPDPNSQNKALFKAVNVDGTTNVIASCLAAHVSTLIFTSSASTVWQGTGQEGLDESAPIPTTFRDAYAETKAQAEALIMAAGKEHGDKLRTISLRPHSIFGPRDPTLFPTAASLAKAGRQRFIVGNGDNLVDWTFVGNVVHSHLLAAEVAQKEGAHCAANGKTYFITNGTPMPFWEFMNWIFLGLGFHASTRRLPYNFVLFLGYIAQFIVSNLNKHFNKRIPLTLSPSRLAISGTAHWYSIKSAQKDLGYKPVWSVQQGMFLTLKSFAHLRNMFADEETLAIARAGNLVALKLVHDPSDVPRFGKELTESLDKTMRGANEEVDEAKLPSFTRAEIAKHASQTDLWVIIDGKVYDLTRYVSTHPGGLDIMKNAGGDATVGFHGLQHPEHVFATVKKFVIGTLEV